MRSLSLSKVKFNSRVNLARIAPRKIKWLTRGFWRGATHYEITLELTARLTLELTLTCAWNKTAEVTIMRFSPYSSPIPLVFAR